MTAYKILFLLDRDSITIAKTQIYGNVEIRPYKYDSSLEREALFESAKSNRENNEIVVYSARICTIVQHLEPNRALEEAINRFTTILDLKSIEHPISSLKLSKIGYIRNLENFDINPYKYQESNYLSFQTNLYPIQLYDINHKILSSHNELAQRYIKAIHWHNKSNNEDNIQLKFLFNFFCIEALFKESDKDNCTDYLSWFLGFPTGHQAQFVDNKIQQELKQSSDYKSWKQKLKSSILDKIRIFRNDSVHSGFRILDIEKNDLILYHTLLQLGSSRALGSARYAINHNYENISEMKSNIATLFNQTMTTQDILATIIYIINSKYN